MQLRLGPEHLLRGDSTHADWDFRVLQTDPKHSKITIDVVHPAGVRCIVSLHDVRPEPKDNQSEPPNALPSPAAAVEPGTVSPPRHEVIECDKEPSRGGGSDSGAGPTGPDGALSEDQEAALAQPRSSPQAGPGMLDTFAAVPELAARRSTARTRRRRKPTAGRGPSIRKTDRALLQALGGDSESQ
eukprot:scaffold1869_cov493-Prasinococcus_capsulatus_cf.AAC.10